jgi:hypothetical protein
MDMDMERPPPVQASRLNLILVSVPLTLSNKSQQTLIIGTRSRGGLIGDAISWHTYP